MTSKNSVQIFLYLFCLSVYLLLMSSASLAIDGVYRFEITENLVERGSLMSACPFLPAQSILQIPLYLVGKISSILIAGESPDAVRRTFVGFFNYLITPLAVLLLFRVALLLKFREKVALWLALVFAFATAAFHYARFNGNEPLLSLLLLGLLYFILSLKEDGGWGNLSMLGVVLLLLIIDNYGMVPIALVTVLLVLIRNHEFKLSFPQRIVLLLMVMVATAFCPYYNYLRYGSIWLTGYQGLLSFPSVSIVRGGLYSILLSPGRSLFLYSPVLILSLFWLGKFLRKQRGFWIRYFLTYLPLYFLLLHSWIWCGGWVWGPRYLLPIIPFLILPLGVALESFASFVSRKKAIFLAVLAVSLLVQLFSIVVHYQYYWITIEDWRTAPSLWRFFSWSQGPFVGQFRILKEALSSHPEYFDFFWFDQFPSHPIGVSLILAGLLAMAVVSLVGLRKALRKR